MESLNKMFLGIVEDIKDPNRKNRIKVRVLSLFEDFETSDLPYASPIGGLTGKSSSLPAVGKVVNVIFPNGDIYDPYYMYSEVFDEYLIEKLNNMDEETYESFNSFLVDKTSELYTTKDLLKIKHLKNQITIDNDSINLELKDNNRKLNIGTSSADQQVILGNRFFEWFDKFIQKLTIPTTLIGNFSAPIIRPELDLLLTEYQQIRNTFLSNHINVVDNNSIKKID